MSQEPEICSLTGHVLFFDVEVIRRGMQSQGVSVVEAREVLRGELEGAGLRKVAERTGRKIARRYVAAAPMKVCI